VVGYCLGIKVEQPVDPNLSLIINDTIRKETLTCKTSGKLCMIQDVQ
jgi:hypothetical protein